MTTIACTSRPGQGVRSLRTATRTAAAGLGYRSPRPLVRTGVVVVATAAALWASSPASAQAPAVRPALDHEDTYRWNTIRTPRISADGRWAAWVVEPWDGDPELVVSRTDGSASKRLRGRGPVFTHDSRHLAYRMPPPRSEVDELRREGKSGDELPGDSLGVLSLAGLEASPGDDGAVFTTGPIESFQVPEDGGTWIAYHLSGDPAEDGDGNTGSEAEGGAGPSGGAAAEEKSESEERSPEYE